ncbi:SPOSA6832_03092, partial [Sporobolomyces salmonicolor]
MSRSRNRRAASAPPTRDPALTTHPPTPPRTLADPATPLPWTPPNRPADPLCASVHRGRVRTKTVKRASRVVIENHTNKKICDEVAIIPSKRLRNKIAGFTTHLMKRIQRGPVRGISFKLQEEERERKDNYGALLTRIGVFDDEADPDGCPLQSRRFRLSTPRASPSMSTPTRRSDLLKTLGFDALSVNVVAPSTSFERPGRRGVVGMRRQDA